MAWHVGETRVVQDTDNPDDIEVMLATERARLVGLCARLSDDIDAAEDLTQETCLEAWRHAHQRRNPAARVSWLSGIARTCVCGRHAAAAVLCQGWPTLDRVIPSWGRTRMRNQPPLSVLRSRWNAMNWPDCLTAR